MTETEKRVPELRFEGFVEDWEQRKLEEDISVVGGATPSKSNPEYWNGPIVWLSSQEIKEKYVSKGTYTITKKAVDDNTTKMVKAGTPLIVSRSGILARLFPISIPTTDVAINQDIKALIFDPNIITTNFFVAQLQKNEEFILRSIVKTGTTVQSINMPDFYKLLLSFPSTDEQEKVGKFFQRLDDAVALHQRKLTLLEQLKKEYLTRMFPQNGENIPNLRFADFSEPWDQRKLGDLGSFKNGMNFDKSAMGHGHPFINLQNIFGKTIVDGTGLGLAVSSEKQRNEYNLLKGDVLFIRSSVKPEGVGEAALVPTNFDNTTFSGFIIRFRPHVAIDNEFKRVIFATKNVRNQIMALATSSANTNINQDSLEMIIIELPRLSEQSKIGNLFKRLDDALYLHQSKIEKLTELKKVLLANMFL